MRTLWAVACWIAVLPCWGLQYQKRDTWRETWDASIEASRPRGITLGPWHVIGPFDHTDGIGFDAVYPPELGVDLTAAYQGKGGREVRWQEGAGFRDGVVNNLRIFDDNDWIAVYMYRTITAEAELSLEASFGSDDGIKVWINGQQVVAQNVSRACMADQNLATLPLHRGDNDLLIKVTQGGGPSGFYFAARGIAPGLGPWYVIGPFDHRGGKGFDAVYPPEQGVDLEAAYEGKDGRPVRWQPGSGFADYTVNSLRIFGDNDEIAVYLFRTVWAPAQMEMPVSLGSDDGIKVWINGELVLAENVTRGCAPDQSHAVLNLRPGRNELLMKIVQGGGPSGFYFAPAGVEQLEDALLLRVLADFPQDAMQIMVERDWMRQDEIEDPTGPYLEPVRRTLRGTRALVEDLRRDGPVEFLAEQALRLDQLGAEARVLEQEAPDGRGERWRSLYLAAHALRREIAFLNPLMDFDKLLFVKHAPTTYSHMCDQNYGWYARPGGGLFVLESVGKSLAVRDVLAGQLPEGDVMHPDLSWDGTRVVFAYWQARPRTPEDGYYHIYEVGVDGSGLRQLTRGPYDDFNPCYLPDGDILFISTRRGGYGRCHGRPVPLYTLHRMRPDGSGIRRLSENEANEWDPSVLADGRIIYSRWDYVDRHAVDYQSLWTCWPDGSNPVALYGNATKNPMANYQARQIPGSHWVITTAAAHHSYTAGSIMAVDTYRDFDGLAPVRRLTPEVPFVESEGWPEKYCYTTPWPLGDNYFLTAFSFARVEPQGTLNPVNQHGLYLVDAFGNRELLYRDPAISSMSPIPLRPRPRPPVLPARSTPEGQAQGRFLLTDVYRSMEGITPGAIKALRVIQIIPKATPIADDPPLGMSGQENGKYVLGTVPVAPDGSAFFTVPANKPVLFQALDERGMAVQSMRTLTYLQPGQTLSCVGCHEHRQTSPPLRRPQAVARGPLELAPPPEGSAPMCYPILVQPVLDKHCVSCHGGEQPRGGVHLGGELTGRFTRSYETLMSRAGLVHRWFAYNGEPVTLPYSSGAHASRLTAMLMAGHHGVELAPEEWERLITWMDANALFYGTYIPQEQQRQQMGQAIGPPALQ